MNVTTPTIKRKTQAEIIRDHLVTKGSITQMEAAGLYCITDLAGRIRDLRDNYSFGKPGFGFDVVSEERNAPNGTRYARYWNVNSFTGLTTLKVNGNGMYLAAA